MANEVQAELWNTDMGTWWVEHHEMFDRRLAAFGDAVLAAASPRPGEHVLDVGCGFGTTTIAAAHLVGDEGRAMGLDVSAVMLDLARQRAAELTNVLWREADAQTATLPGGHFSVVMSRFGVMFFDDPVAAFVNLRSASVQGGRLAVVCWQGPEANEWISVPMAVTVAQGAEPTVVGLGGPGMFSFAERAHLAAVLGDAGWGDVVITAFEAPMRFGLPGAAVDEVAAELSQSSAVRVLLGQLDEPRRAAALGGIAEFLAPRRAPDGTVELTGRAWVVTATAS